MPRIDKQMYLSDYYNKYAGVLEGKDINELIEIFNYEQGLSVASNARFKFLNELDKAFTDSKFDCTAIMSPVQGLSFRYPIILDGQRIVQLIED
tara:strand:- start:3141 stop:3422 length:282 start_codon:yes stop_codon:yes gene_type:complete